MPNSNRLHLLIVEDQRELANNMGQYFESYGYIIDFALTGPQGLNLALTHHYDVIILDIMLPGLDGLSVCAQLRQKSDRHIPVIMLTARDTLEDKISGFKQGADDYLTKPFALEELHMRCLALAKRHRLHKEQVIVIGELKIDRQRQKAFRQDQALDLNTMGFQILNLLGESFPAIVTRSELSQKLWGDEPTESDSLRSHIYQLRQALDKPFATPMLKTIHGVGFTLDIDD